MSTTLARKSNDLQPQMGQPRPGGVFAPWLGFDPFEHLRASYAFEYDLTRTEDGYEVEIPVPGYTPSEIDVTVEDALLTVSGKSDRRSFSRSLILPDDVNAESIQAKVENGLMHLSLRRVPEAQPRKIHVS